MTTFLIACLAFVSGGIWGSFLGVLAIRIPQGISIISPGSRCDHCTSPLSFFELIPYYSWILSKGHCQRCHQKIPREIPIAEFSTGFFFLTVAIFSVSIQEGLELILFFSFALPLTMIDIRYHRLPHALTMSGAASAVLFSLMTHGIKGLMISISGSLIGFLPIAALATFYKRGIGMGDAFWLGAIGAYTGPERLTLVLLVASLSGILSLLGLHVLTYAEDRQPISDRPIPFGPFLSLGGILALAFPGTIHILNSFIMEIPI